MKRVVVPLILSLLNAPLNALPSGSPFNAQGAIAGLLSSRHSPIICQLGTQRDHLLERPLQSQNSSTDAIFLSHQAKQCILTVSIPNVLQIYGSTGILDPCIAKKDPQSSTLNIDGLSITKQQPLLKYPLPSRSIYAAGVKGTVMYWGNVVLTADLQHQEALPPSQGHDMASELIDSFQRWQRWMQRHLQRLLEESPPTPQADESEYSEWHTALSLGYRIALFHPYIAMRYTQSHTAVPVEGSKEMLKLHNQMPIGISFGCSLCNNKLFDLNVETRLLDEQAWTISGSFRL